mmetsp:Transcript_25710/g.76087  ORF Transcript_25710/g.76087 Transcript_25710/m.76087 type:complete len:233 (-) Transcript_25710:971-1669(-)
MSCAMRPSAAPTRRACAIWRTTSSACPCSRRPFRCPTRTDQCCSRRAAWASTRRRRRTTRATMCHCRRTSSSCGLRWRRGAGRTPCSASCTPKSVWLRRSGACGWTRRPPAACSAPMRPPRCQTIIDAQSSAVKATSAVWGGMRSSTSSTATTAPRTSPSQSSATRRRSRCSHFPSATLAAGSQQTGTLSCLQARRSRRRPQRSRYRCREMWRRRWTLVGGHCARCQRQARW